MKKRYKLILYMLVIGYMLSHSMCVNAEAIIEKGDYAAVDPQKAIICAVVAGIAGILLYLWRHREKVKK